ncbi:tRNA 2-thiouridine(34) synthase MnmA [Guggenheimella bovis]
MSKIQVGLSGGVDSAVASYLLKEEGHSVTGTFLLLNELDTTLKSLEEAREVAKTLEIPFEVLDLKEAFRETVIEPFKRAYREARTPNPCILCNKAIKFGLFLDKAIDKGFDYVATGHYARVYEENGRFRVKKAKDPFKDQTYMFYTFSQETLSRLMMPLASYEKEDVRQIAKNIGLSASNKPDSQDICFIPDGDYARFLLEEGEKEIPGEFFFDGKVIGSHKGLLHYTVGQRKGLGISYSEPLFVKGLDQKNNRVLLSTQSELYRDSLTGTNFNAIYEDLPLEQEIELDVKVRYSHTTYKGNLTLHEKGHFQIDFKEPVRAITPGQSVVCYLGDDLYGGGIID